MITQKSLRNDNVLKKYIIGAHPIIQTFMDRLKISDIIGTYIPHDKRQKISTEKTLSVLIHNILTNPLPMYEMADWIIPLDEEKIGLIPGESEFINDDRIGKALKAFYISRHKDIFFHLALRAIKIFELECNQIHQDTTTITFYGKYLGWNASQSLAYGYNKDHRPDLKQLVLGMSVTADGFVPLSHKIYDGNQSDDCLHFENHKRISKLLKKTDFIYVADCKLATEDNLDKISAYGGKFLTVMPRTWKEDKQFRDKVRNKKVKWNFLLSRPNNRNPKWKHDRYYLAEGEYKALKKYRLIWILSIQKAEEDAERREKRINKTLAELNEIQIKINTYNLKTQKKIEIKIKEILKENKCLDFIDYTIQKNIQYEIHYRSVGRPKFNEKGKKVSKEYYSLSFKVNKLRIDEEKLTDGVFPLITNLKDKNPKKILEIYKYQPFLEYRHTQLKTYQKTAQVFLKCAKRIIAYLHMHVMSLMVATLIERQLRLAMKKNNIKSLPIYPEGKLCEYPTCFDIVRLFKNVERYEVIQGEKISIFPAKLNDLHKEVLGLLEVPISFYQ